MISRSTLLLLSAVGVSLAALSYASRRKSSTSNKLGEILNTLQQNLDEARALHRTLRRQRGAINDIHRYLVPVSKGS